jgi:acyl carrier protein
VPAETHVQGRGGGDTRKVAEVVYEVVSEVTGTEIGALGDQDELTSLGVTGLVLVDVMDALMEELGERTVGFSVDDEDLASVRTLGELVSLVSLVTEGVER